MGKMGKTEGEISGQCDMVGKLCRKKIRYILLTKGKERARDDKMMENFYYACRYDILQEPTQPKEKSASLHQLKAKIIRLQNKRMQTITIDARDPKMYEGENPSIFRLIQGRKRRSANDPRNSGRERESADNYMGHTK